MSTRSILARAKAAQVVHLVSNGHTYADAAALAGYRSAGAAHTAARALIDEQVHDDVERIREQQLQGYLEVLRVLAPRVLTGDLPAIDRALAVRRDIRRLTGTDAPQRVVVTQLDPLTEQLEVLARQLDERARAQTTPPVRALPAAPQETR